ncbi:MAG TPA: hypothetical protein VKF17_16885 [Isosphaeraceae bacterium]|nr:hypothetical protein [Isosphaeraceae bacterium]
MNDSAIPRLELIEDRFERQILLVQQLQRQVANLANQIQQVQGQQGGSGTGSGGIVYFLNPIAISPGGSVTGQTIWVNLGGTQTASGYTNATVYNEMASATVATSGKIIIVGPNPDGTWSVITQSC